MLRSGDSASAVIVGAGIFGTSLADALTARRWEVTLVERYSPANWRSSSGDVSRLLRFGHGAGDGRDEWYTRSAWTALQLWRAIEEEERRELLVNTGAMWLSHTSDGWEAAAEETMHRVGVPLQHVSRDELSAYLPELCTDDLLYGLYEPAAGVLRAAESVQVLFGRARRRGARTVYGSAAPHPDGVFVNDEIISADRVVWACGAWLGQLFPGWAPVTPTRQHVFYWNSPPQWRTGPAWIDSDRGFYGFPDLDGAGLKALSDRCGQPFDLEGGSRQLHPRAEAEAKEYLANRFPALAGIQVLRGYVMHYEMTPDRTFLIGPLPGQDRVWLLGGGSGHGFKHGPALGAYVADLLEGRQQLDERFAIPAVDDRQRAAR
jgi:sarcosine oxidase